MNEQPRFDGPGVYGIVAYQDPGFCANSWGGTTNVDEAVKLHPVASSGLAPNERWAFAQVTDSSKGEQAVFVLLNVRNGYYLAVKSDDTLYCSNKTPTDDSALWTVSDVSRESNGYHVFQIKSVSGGQLDCPDGYSRGAKIVRSKSSGADTTKFYIVTKTP